MTTPASASGPVAGPPAAAPAVRSPASSPARARRRAVGGALAAAGSVLALVAAGLPEPAPLGIGDRLFPSLGNPGYDVGSYDISLRYTGDNTRPLRARTRLRARVTADRLDRLNLDFAAGKVRSVRVNGRPARHTRTGEDLVVTPERPVWRGTPLRVDVRHTSPTGRPERGGWVRTADGLAMANQADAAHRVFPCNDHPSDKARFTFHLTAPDGLTAVAAGALTGKESRGGNTTWTYRGLHPMATELAQVSLGRSTVLRREGPHGLPLRDVVPAGRADGLEPWLSRTPAQISWLERQVGRYPFETYGLLVADARTGFELETQTLSLFERSLFASRDFPGWYKESVMVHELAHQWFGNSVSPHRWSDLWLNEGHATWYEWRYAEHRGGARVEDRVRSAYERSDGWRRAYGPPAAPHPVEPGDKTGIFRKIMYDGSALVLHALREKIGAGAFQRLERAWVARHQHGVASTDDFAELVNEVSGRDLTAFLHGWLYGEKTPPMPGHPRWRSR